MAPPSPSRPGSSPNCDVEMLQGWGSASYGGWGLGLGTLWVISVLRTCLQNGRRMRPGRHCPDHGRPLLAGGVGCTPCALLLPRPTRFLSPAVTVRRSCSEGPGSKVKSGSVQRTIWSPPSGPCSWAPAFPLPQDHARLVPTDGVGALSVHFSSRDFQRRPRAMLGTRRCRRETGLFLTPLGASVSSSVKWGG